jgi:hypothetical protein
LRAIPPELFSLPKSKFKSFFNPLILQAEFNTNGNPLAGGIVFPSWFFGATFG